MQVRSLTDDPAGPSRAINAQTIKTQTIETQSIKTQSIEIGYREKARVSRIGIMLVFAALLCLNPAIMRYAADLHVHSSFSRATAKNLDLENLYIAAQIKGITLVGTGDFTHPRWLAEIREKLAPAEPGIFRLKPEIARECDKKVPPSCRGEVRFILQCEISNIYKKEGRTRKNHQVIFLPDLAAAQKFSDKLDAIGNIRSDGRPILGLDAKRLFEILLECSGEGMLIPAHIWTPWFSVLGSKSGFDSIEECFEELTPEIFAVETGLSSDPPMNWRVSMLDNFTLVSNSDAHSPMNLGRNANLFNTDLSYPALRDALKSGDPDKCRGTLDLYPQEGKYHYDGHRKCRVRLHPKETIERGGTCPECGKPLTIGVLYRVETLADRPEEEKPESALPCRHIIPLAEILSELLRVGVKTKKVGTAYDGLVNLLGPELPILLDHPIEAIETGGVPLLGEAIRRMRAQEVHLLPGYDGEYGRITLYEKEEMENLLGQQALFPMPKPLEPEKRPKSSATPRPKEAAKPSGTKPESEMEDGISAPAVPSLNPEQEGAVMEGDGPLLVIAGPGAGKTRTLTHRIAHLIEEEKAAPESILAVTFTNKAAEEMRTRLQEMIGKDSPLPTVSTFHAFCLKLLQESEASGKEITIIDEEEQLHFAGEAIRQYKAGEKADQIRPERLLLGIGIAKQNLLPPPDVLSRRELFENIFDEEALADFPKHYEIYQTLLEQAGRFDFEDLIYTAVQRLENDPQLLLKYRERLERIFIDEYQDLNYGQYRLVRLLSPKGGRLFVIGDPDQAIYGFRGSDVAYFRRFTEDYPDARTIRLRRNYRSAETILQASHQVIQSTTFHSGEARVYSGIEGIETLTVLELPTEKAEAVAIGKIIERMVGGASFHSYDFGKAQSHEKEYAFSDFAVLFRTHVQMKTVQETFDRAGIPCQVAARTSLWGQKGIFELIGWLKLVEDRAGFHDLEKIAKTTGISLGSKLAAEFRNWYYSDPIMPLSEAFAHVRAFPIRALSTKEQRRLTELIDRISELKETTSEKSLPEKIELLLESTGLHLAIEGDQRREEALNRLRKTAQAHSEIPSDFFAALSLQTDPDTYEKDAQKVALMTFHGAKGLEFPVVFVAGCEKGLIPFEREGKRPSDADEERRLFYVGMTRAKERLYLTRARKRFFYGKELSGEISPFVADIEQRLLTIERPDWGGAKDGEKGSDQVQLGLFN